FQSGRKQSATVESRRVEPDGDVVADHDFGNRVGAMGEDSAAVAGDIVDDIGVRDIQDAAAAPVDATALAVRIVAVLDVEVTQVRCAVTANVEYRRGGPSRPADESLGTFR